MARDREKKLNIKGQLTFNLLPIHLTATLNSLIIIMNGRQPWVEMGKKWAHSAHYLYITRNGLTNIKNRIYN